ncbi:MAG: hypothetical protein AB1861_05555 [Cyanobacteriota bacterium]
MLGNRGRSLKLLTIAAASDVLTFSVPQFVGILYPTTATRQQRL